MEHKIDRISELPQPVLEHILSFIPFKKTLQLSILSKRWQNVWALLPIPEFDQYIPEFNPYTYDKKLGNLAEIEKEQISLIKRTKFNSFMERILRSHCRQRLSINTFKLSMILDESDCALLNRCIGYAIESNVKVFNLCVMSSCYYKLPESVLTAKSITELTLDSCEVDSFCSDINLSSLKKLSLNRVCMEDQFIQTLIAGCPVVEDISFDNCHGLKSIQVSGLPKLVTLKMIDNSDLEMVEIQESNLQSLYFFYFNPCQVNLASSENLKKLEFERAPIVTDKWLHEVLLKHPQIEILDLKECNVLERVYISSHRLKTLNLFGCKNLVEVNIDTPNLHKFGYDGDFISLSLNAMALLEANLTFWGDSCPLKKIAFLAKLSHPKLLTWTTSFIESVIIDKSWRDIQPSPLYNVKKLELKSIYAPKRYKIVELVDALLWISPLLQILFIEWIDENKAIDGIFFKFSYENRVYKGENPNCCKLLPNLCWRHCLKTVKIEDSRGFADEKDLEKYFFENAKILESFQYSRGSVLLKHS